MAQIIPCDGPHEEPTAAVLLITLITEAETTGLCAACGVDWAQGYLTILAPDALAPKPSGRKSRAKTPPPLADDPASSDGHKSESAEV